MAGMPMQRRRSCGRALLTLAAVALCAYQSLMPATFKTTAQVPAPGDVLDEEGLPIEQASMGAALGQLVGDNSEMAAAVVLLLCLLVAKTEPKIAPPAAVALDKRGDYNGVLFINGLLSLTSGMINALAFLQLGATIAHHTGNMTHFGRNWGTDSFRFGCYLFAYLFGGAVVGYVQSDTEAIFAGRKSISMVSAVMAEVGCTCISLLGGKALPCLMLWAFSQGLQNCLCRKFSSMPLCSTHFTGYLTDAGANMGQMVQAKMSGEALPNVKKTVLFTLCIIAFAAGGFLAKVGQDYYGLQVAFVPSVLMATVAMGLYPVFPKPAPQGKKQ